MDTYSRKLLEIQQYINEHKTENMSALAVLDMIKSLEITEPSININSVGGNNIINFNSDVENETINCGTSTPSANNDSSSDSGNDTEGSDSSISTCNKSVILINANYKVTSNDYYIGVNAEEPITITLPKSPTDGLEFIIKIEGEMNGNKKVTIITEDGSKIDSDSSIILKTTHDKLRIIFRNPNWHII